MKFMSSVFPALKCPAIVYPDSDGEPIAENTLQFEYLTTIQGNLDAQFRDDPNVFVAGALLWYPVEGHPEIREAPDVFVAFGRPKGRRGPYMQFVEGNVAPQVVFEIWPPGWRREKGTAKFQFYERYGVEEYYTFDHDSGELEGWFRKGDHLKAIPKMAGWVSPRLKVRFLVGDNKLRLYGPGGRQFLTFVEHAMLLKQAQCERAECEREQAQHQAEDQAMRAERLAAQLRALGVEPGS